MNNYMDKKDFKILLDMDDCLEFLLNAWINYLNHKYDLCVNFEEIDNWDIRQFFPSLTEDQLYEPLELPEFWSTVKPNTDAMYYVKKLYDEGFDIYVCTSTHHNIVSEKMKRALKPYYPFINWKHVIIANCKQMIKGDVLIDDNYSNLPGGDYTGILYTRPHNKNIALNKSNNIYRVFNWEEVYNLVKQLYERKTACFKGE